MADCDWKLMRIGKMGINAMRTGAQIKRILSISIRTSYRSACNHPVLLGLICYLIILYRSFPFLFSLLVSASPVLVCTALLLGTLLSYGEPNIPEIEKEIEKEKDEEVIGDEISPLKAGLTENATVVVKTDESFCFERFKGTTMDTSEENLEDEGLAENKLSKKEDDGLGDYMPLTDDGFHEIQFEKQLVVEVGKDLGDVELESKKEIHEEKKGLKDGSNNGETSDSRHALIENVRNKIYGVEEDKSRGHFLEAREGGLLDSSKDLFWKQPRSDDDDDDDEEEEEEEKEEEEEEEDDDDDEDTSESESDGAESSSPDASMADIIPMLDELHPLLDEEAPHQAQISHQGSYTDSMLSQNPDDGEDSDNDNDQEEQEPDGEKEDESKSAIKWTEDDQKNLMDLGTLELERNQRLESLIARRRARRNMRLMAEKNLIDFDGADLPVNIPPISTSRRNPFDLPFDPYDDAPGSAPSILLPRANPFDLPYDPNEEKPDLKGDSFQQEFSGFQQREQVFRRHESFSVGSSVLGASKQDRQDLHWKPYFVPERFCTEGTSYGNIQRQLSELSDSKVSDAESLSSAMEEDDKKPNEEDTDLISNMDHASVLVERGSLSSEDADLGDIEQVEKRDTDQDEAGITLGEVENYHEINSSMYASGVATHVEPNTTQILLKMEQGEEEDSSRSSLSSLSEVDEKLPNGDAISAALESKSTQIVESHISSQGSADSEFHFMGVGIDGGQYQEPIVGSQSDCIQEPAKPVEVLVATDIQFTEGMSKVQDDNQVIEPVSGPSADCVEGSDTPNQTLSEPKIDSVSGIVEKNQEEGILEPKTSTIGIHGFSTQSSRESDVNLATCAGINRQHKDAVYDSSPPSFNEFLSCSSSSSGTLDVPDIGSPLTIAELRDKESEDVDLKAISSGSTHQNVLSEGKPLFEVEPQLSWLDKSIVDPSVDNHGGQQEQSVILEDPPEHVSITKDVSVSGIHDSKNIISRIMTSLVPSDSPKYYTPAARLGMKEDNFDKIVYEDRGQVFQRNYSLVEAYGSPIAEESINDEDDEIKEINENLLSELDTVGDFSVKEVVGETVGDEKIREENDPENHECEILPNDANLTETMAELPVLEVRSVEDIELVFEQLREGADVEEVIIPSTIKDQVVVAESTGPEQISSDLQVVEAKSLEDIHIAMQQISDPKYEEPSRPLGSKDEPEDVNKVDSTNEVPVLEVQTIGDIALKQHNNGVEIEEIILPRTIVHQPVGNELKDSGQTSSNLQVFGATSTSLEDVDVTKPKASETNTEVMLASSNANDELNERNDLTSATGVLLGSSNSNDEGTERSELASGEELPLLEMKTKDDIDSYLKQLNEMVDIEEVILPNMTEQLPVVDECHDSGQILSELLDGEASSTKDTHVAMMQVAHNVKELPEPSEAEDKLEIENEMASTDDIKLGISEVNEVNSTQDNESSKAEEIQSGSTQERDHVM